MRKRIVWLTALAFLVLLTACGGGGTTPSSPPEAAGDEGDATAAYPQPYAPPAASAPALSMSEMAYAPPGAEDARVAKYPNPIVVYVRHNSGGTVIGKWTIYQTGRIVALDGSEQVRSADEVKPIFDLVTTQEFRKLEGRFAPGETCPGCQIQRILVYGPEEPVEIEIVGEPDLPPPVQQVLQAITAVIE